MQEQLYVSKWVTFAASCCIMASSGLSYTFSVYAPTIKDILHLSQTELATVGSAVNLGGFFAIISGATYDLLSTQHRLGPRVIVCIGCLMCFCGYGGLYLMADGKVTANFGLLLLFGFAAGNAGTWFDTSALVTNVRNFPSNRGLTVGVLKSFLGLSSSIYTSVYAALFEPDAVQFLLMLATVPSVLGLLLSLGLNYVPCVEAKEEHSGPGFSWHSTEGRFLLSFTLVSLLALYQVASALLLRQQQLGQMGKDVMLVGMLLLLLLTAVLPLHCGSCSAAYGHAYTSPREGSIDGEDGQDVGVPSELQPQMMDGHGRADSVDGHLAMHHRQLASSSSGSSTASDDLAKSVGIHPAGSAQVGSLHRHGDDILLEDDTAPLLVPIVDRTAGAATSAGSASTPQSADGISKTAALATSSTALPAGSGVSAGSTPGCANSKQDHQQQQQGVAALSTGEMLCTLTFWLLFMQFMIGSGACLAYLNNLGQLVVSLGGKQDDQVVFVSLFSVANAAGRLVMGYLPERSLHTRGTPRTHFLTVTAAVTAAVSLAVAYADLTQLYVISLLLGLAFGAHWSLLPAIMSELFGLKHFAPNYTTLKFAPAAGGYLLATRLTGWLYDTAAARHGDSHECIGPDCFRVAFLLLSAVAAISSVACSVATARSRVAYEMIAAQLSKVDSAAQAHTDVEDC